MRGDTVRRIPCLTIFFCGAATFRLVRVLLALAVLAAPSITEAERGGMPDSLSGHDRAAVNGAGDARRVALHSTEAPLRTDADGWIDMPGGARPAYIGIHGGTMPVSLLATRGGSAMVAMVGETGSDFLYVLRGGRTPSVGDDSPQSEAAAELLAAARAAHGGQAFTEALDASRSDLSGAGTSAMPEPGANGTVLFAATPEGSVPVIYASGRSFESLDIALTDWTPFGLTEDHTVGGKGKHIAATTKNTGQGKSGQVGRSGKSEKRNQADSRRSGKVKSRKSNPQDRAGKVPRLPRNEKGPVSIQDAMDALVAA